MFDFFKKKPRQGEQVAFQISGMHCVSCSLNIDGQLEETKGVVNVTTSYAKAQTVITYDPGTISIPELQKIIESLDYEVTQLNTN